MDFFKGLIRSGNARNTARSLETNEEGDLYIAGGRAAPYTEIARGGEMWSLIGSAGTPLVVIPTTLCILEIWNNTQRAFEVIDLFLFHLLGTAALHNQSLWAEVTAPKAAPSLLAATVVGSHSGKAPYTATAGTDLVPGGGTTVVSAGWRPYGTPGSGVVSTALPGEAFSVPVDGKLIVPPRCSVAITCVDALATASSVQVGATVNFRRGLTLD